MTDDTDDDNGNDDTDDDIDADDPFERLGEIDREGDPFERLDDASETAETTGADADDLAVADWNATEGASDPFADFDRDAETGAQSETETDETAADGEPIVDDTDPGDPFADMDEPASDPFGRANSVFERVDVGSVDDDEVWAAITGDGDDGPVVPDGDRYAEVSKHAFCEQCEFFSAPPDAHCTHETAEIDEYLDMEHVRLRDCPIVAQRNELE